MSLYNRVKENCEVVGKVIQINLKVKRIYFKKLLLKKVTINTKNIYLFNRYKRYMHQDYES